MSEPAAAPAPPTAEAMAEKKEDDVPYPVGQRIKILVHNNVGVAPWLKAVVLEDVLGSGTLRVRTETKGTACTISHAQVIKCLKTTWSDDDPESWMDFDDVPYPVGQRVKISVRTSKGEPKRHIAVVLEDVLGSKTLRVRTEKKGVERTISHAQVIKCLFTKWDDDDDESWKFMLRQVRANYRATIDKFNAMPVPTLEALGCALRNDPWLAAVAYRSAQQRALGYGGGHVYGYLLGRGRRALAGTELRRARGRGAVCAALALCGHTPSRPQRLPLLRHPLYGPPLVGT